MKIQFLFVGIIFLSLTTGCSRENLTVQIIRNPLVQFDLDGTQLKATGYSFSGPSVAVVYPTNPALPAGLYYRYSLIASGKDSIGTPIIFNLVFDVSDTTQLPGDYRVSYTSGKGLNQVQILQTGAAPEEFSLCANDTVTPLLHIQKQSVDERLIAGSFQMTLCNNRDTTQKIIISNGVLTDVTY